MAESGNLTPSELRERSSRQADEGVRRPAPQDHKVKGEDKPQEKRRTLKPLGADPVKMEYAGKDFYIYPRAFDDWRNIESVTGIDFGFEEEDTVRPVPGAAEIRELDARGADMWEGMWRALGWDSIPDDDVKEEYKRLRLAIREKNGYVSSIMFTDFVQETNELLEKKMDASGN